ncbi:LysR family transcriptional regulator [Gammaproteobacteria bacterium]|nr:LysR family transcriptional regulator [Gammaproteobacteria bacterium]
MTIKSPRLPSTRCLLAFEASARLESFTMAAQQLNTSQSSISRHISELEASLQTVLFIRSKQRVRLSEKGKHLYSRVNNGLDNIRGGMQTVANWDVNLPVTIGCTHAISHLLIMPVFEELQNAMSDFGQVRVMTTEYAILDADPDPQIDIVFAYDVSEIPTSEYVPLLAEAVKPVCSPEFKIQHATELAKPPESWRDITLLDLALPNRGWASWDDWFQSYDTDLKLLTEARFDNYIYLLEACASGRGLALGARGMVDTYLSNGRLVQAYEDYVCYDRRFYAVLTERARKKAAPRRCVEALSKLLYSQS